jgi:hypothetical protein
MRKTIKIRNFIVYFSIFALVFAQGNHPTAKKTEIIIVSAIGDPVSNNQSGPFQPASTAYLAGWEKPRFDGGLANYAFIKGATWIWMKDFIGDFQQPLYFPKIFYIPEGATEITGTLEITADNFFSFSINGLNYRGTGPPDRRQWANVYRFSITNLKPGENYLFITAYEVHPQTPSGLVYKLTVQYKEIPVVKIEDTKDFQG